MGCEKIILLETVRPIVKSNVLLFPLMPRSARFPEVLEQVTSCSIILRRDWVWVPYSRRRKARKPTSDPLGGLAKGLSSYYSVKCSIFLWFYDYYNLLFPRFHFTTRITPTNYSLYFLLGCLELLSGLPKPSTDSY